MKVEEYREKVLSQLSRQEEQLKTLFKETSKIERQLEKLNGSVAEHRVDIAKIKTWGSVALFVIPTAIHLILKGI